MRKVWNFFLVDEERGQVQEKGMSQIKDGEEMGQQHSKIIGVSSNLLVTYSILYSYFGSH